ncbi:MAG: type II toxin-antitoxin system VapC family toxin [Endomicrobia bacterium]|nr:type II toxin-antitoxin system VapC family toxin [Endomicrobiia bacterium]
MYLLDTNICIYIIKKKPEAVLKHLKIKYPKGLFISSITLAELEQGVENSAYPEKNSVALMSLLSIIDIIPFDSNAAKEYGKIKTDLKKRGCIIGELDMLIAACAKAENFILVTNNTKEFNRIKDLKIENWALNN